MKIEDSSWFLAFTNEDLPPRESAHAVVSNAPLLKIVGAVVPTGKISKAHMQAVRGTSIFF